MENYPDILTSNKSNTEKVDDLVKIEGFSEKTANMFVPYIEDFFQFMNNIGIEDRLYDNNNTSNSNHILSDTKIVKYQAILVYIPASIFRVLLAEQISYLHFW